MDVVWAVQSEVALTKANHFAKTSGTSFTEIAWDVMTDIIEWDSSDFVDEYATSGDLNYRDYYELYRFLYQHEDSVMETPCKHNNQPSVCEEEGTGEDVNTGERFGNACYAESML